jgi:ferredoxin-type protein NapH
VLGFHFADLNSSLQLMLAHKHVVLNLVIGVDHGLPDLHSVRRAQLLLVGLPLSSALRIAEMLHLKLAEKAAGQGSRARPAPARRDVRHLRRARLRHRLHAVRTISPVGILSRA